MADKITQKQKRPLSPHLQVYKPQMTSVMSILHRATGYALAVGTIMVIWMLAAAATGPEAFQFFTGFCNSLIGTLLLLGWSLALFYHMGNGMRHLLWDMGFLFEIKNAYLAGYMVWFFAIVLTAATWICAGF